MQRSPMKPGTQGSRVAVCIIDSSGRGWACIRFANRIGECKRHLGVLQIAGSGGGRRNPREMSVTIEELMTATQKNDTPEEERFLRRSEAAKYVVDKYNMPCSPKTLAKLACVSSDGPPFRLAGRFPLYPVSGLDAWAQGKIGPLIRSTSQKYLGVGEARK